MMRATMTPTRTTPAPLSAQRRSQQNQPPLSQRQSAQPTPTKTHQPQQRQSTTKPKQSPVSTPHHAHTASVEKAVYSTLVAVEEPAQEFVHLAVRTRGHLDTTAELAPPTNTHLFLAGHAEAHLHTHLIAPLVASAFNGYNANVVCCGGALSGKSTTMWGTLLKTDNKAEDESEDRENQVPASATTKPAKDEGMASFVLEQIFQTAAKEEAAGVSTTVVSLSLVGIGVTDNMIDFLAKSTAPLGTPTSAVGTPTTASTVKLQEDSSSKLIVANMTKKLVSSKGGAMRILEAVMGPGMRKKTHVVATITVEKQMMPRGTITSAQVQLIDLASPENVLVSEPEDSTSVIRRTFNKSLATLDKVVSILSDVSPAAGTLLSPQASPQSSPQSSPRHLPWRESKLTRMLKDGMGCASSRTHTLFVMCLQASASAVEANRASLEFGRKLKKISNTMCDASAAVIQRPHSMHEVVSQKKRKQAQRAAESGVPRTPARSPQTPARSPVPSARSGRASTMQTPTTSSRVRRQLFESEPAKQTPAAPVVVAVPETPQPELSVLMQALDESSANQAAAMLSGPDDAPEFSSPTRRWRFSASFNPATPSQGDMADQAARLMSPSLMSPGLMSPASRRRWTITSATAPPPPTPFAPNAFLALQAAHSAMERRLQEALAMVEQLTAKQLASASMLAELQTGATRSATAIEDAATHMAQESAAMSHCDILRTELAALTQQLQMEAARQQQQIDTVAEGVEVSLVPSVFTDSEEASSLVLGDACFLSPCTSPTASAGFSFEASPGLVRSTSRIIQTKISEQPEEEENEEEEEEEKKQPCTPLPSFVLPVNHAAIPSDLQQQMELAGDKAASIAEHESLADLMRRSLSLPVCLRPTLANETIIAPYRPFPASPGQLNLVNTLMSPAREAHEKYVTLASAPSDEAASASPSTYRFQASSSACSTPQRQLRWLPCCGTQQAAAPSVIADLTIPLASEAASASASDPAEVESSELFSRIARLTALRKEQWGRLPIWQRTGCSIM